MTHPLDRRGLMAGGAALAAYAALPRVARAQDNTLRIGVLNDQSALYRDISGPGSVACVKQAVAESVAAGGPSAEVLVGDHQNKPDVGSSIAREWIDQRGVDLIIDVPNSAVALAVANVCKEKDRVFIDSGAATADLTGKQCAPTTIHWTYDTWMLAHSTGGAMVKSGGDSWFFITADYAFGAALERDTTAFVTQSGGKVLGSVKVPLANADFSSYLVQAQSSGAKVVGLANSGGDTINSIKQAAEFGLASSGQKLAALLVFISDIHSLGLPVAKGLVLTETFYWDLNDRTRAFTKRVDAAMGGAKPGMGQAGCYAGALHFLKAAHKLGADAKKSGAAMVDAMKALPTDDDAFGAGSIRPDGRALHPAYLFEVKGPTDSKGPWDYYKLVATTPANDAFRPLADGGCALVKS